jgi:hypothetical protein
MFVLYLIIFVLMMIDCIVIVWWGARMKGPPRTVTAWAASIIFITMALATPFSQIELYWNLIGRSPRDDWPFVFLLIGENLFALAAILFVASKGEKAKRGPNNR